MNHEKSIRRQRQRRSFRVRARTRGTAERPRLSVARSHKHISVQLIDDQSGQTLAAASTLEGDLKSAGAYGGNKSAAQAVGKTLAERAIAQGVKQICFDRGAYRYHGRVAALADAAREAGLEF